MQLRAAMLRCLAVAWLLAACGTESSLPASDENLDYVTNAILVPYCAHGGCHTDATQPHGLAFDTVAHVQSALQQTGRDGVPILTRFSPHDSELYLVMISSDRPMPPDMTMPHPDIELIGRWITDGANGAP